jgi:Flp pilus assembly protein TadG
MKTILNKLHRPVGRRGPTQAEHGQSLVETALVLPILILLLAIVVDAGRLFDASIVLVQAAREGARFSTVQPALSESQIQELVVNDVLGSGTNITHMSDFTADNVDVDPGDSEVTVTVFYDFPLWFGGVLGLDTVRVTRQAVMPTYLPEARPTFGPTPVPVDPELP